MGRHRIRSLLSSIFKDHLDSNNHGWLEEHRKEIEDKMKKILELVDEEKGGNPNEEEDLTGLIHDFYQYHQVLHERYDQLAGYLQKNVHGRGRNGASSSSSSSSDSETEKSGSNDKRSKHHKFGEVYKDLQDQHENLKQELRASQDAENDMKQKFMSVTEEKNNLLVQNANALGRLHVADKKVEELVMLSEQWNKDKLLFDAEISDLMLQLETERKLVANLKTSLAATDKEKNELNLLSRQWNKDKLLLDAEISDLKLQLDTERKLAVDLKSSLEATDKEKNEVSLEIISALRKAEDVQNTVENLEIEVKVLRGENVTLLSNIESHKQENTVTMDSLQQAHKTIEDHSSEMEKLTHEHSVLRAEKEAAGKEISNLNEILTATYSERDVLTSNQLSMTGKLEDAERIIEELKKEIQLLKLGLSERDAINNDLQELEVACQKIDTQSQLLLMEEESKNKLILENSEVATKLEQAGLNLQEAREKVQLLMEENVIFRQRHDDLVGKVRDLEHGLMKKEEEISYLQKKYEVEKNEAFGQIDDLKIQINEHQLQHSFLSTVKRELEEQIEMGKNEAQEKHKQTESLKEKLTGKIRELEQKYEDREKEVSNLIAVLEEARSKASEHIDDLQSKHSLLSSQKQEAEGKVETVEKELTEKILELEKLLEEKEEMSRISDENHKQLEAKFQKSCDELQEAESKGREVEESLRMLRLEVTGLTMEMALVAALKNELEDNFEKAKNELSELELQKEKLYRELQSKISNHEIMVQERDNRLSESEMKYKQLEDQVFDVSEKLKSAEQWIEELEEDRLKVEAAKDVIIQNLQVTIEEMTRDIKTSEEEINRLKGEVSKHIEDYKLLQICTKEEKAATSTKMDTLQQLNDDQKEELAKLKESLQGAEVQLRLLTRKLQITESEFEKKEEFFRRKEEEMHEKHKLHEEQVSLSSKKITTLENERKEMYGTTTDALKSLNSEFGNLVSAIQRLDEYHCRTHLRLSEFSRELQVVKKSLSDTKSHKQVLRGEIQDLTQKLVDTERSKYLLENKLGLAETTMKETVSQKNKLMKSVADYVKKMGEIEMEVQRREVEVAEKNEEKREVIRQLCIYIEYNRENHNIVKESLLKMMTRTRRSA